MRGLALWFEPGEYAVSVLLLAAGLDFLVGDPWGWPHPVQAMGRVIDLYSQWALARTRSPAAMRLLGVGLFLLLVGGSAAVCEGGLWLLAQLSPVLRWLAEIILLASCFAGRSLRRAAEDVLSVLPASNAPSGGPLNEAALAKARQQLAMYVGRDTAQLSPVGIRRAVLETVSENAVDGVLAPLFFAILGGLFGLMVPIAVGYKAASTLDSMVGYKEAPYTDLGWCSARLEDGLTWLPCRISVLTIALLSGRPVRVLALCWRDARSDPSPNSGWSECVFAAALGVQLGGPNTYKGKLKIKPLLGDDKRPITNGIITQALSLVRWSFWCGLGLGASGLYFVAL